MEYDQDILEDIKEAILKINMDDVLKGSIELVTAIDNGPTIDVDDFSKEIAKIVKDNINQDKIEIFLSSYQNTSSNKSSILIFAKSPDDPDYYDGATTFAHMFESPQLFTGIFDTLEAPVNEFVKAIGKAGYQLLVYNKPFSRIRNIPHKIIYTEKEMEDCVLSWIKKSGVELHCYIKNMSKDTHILLYKEMNNDVKKEIKRLNMFHLV